MTTAHRPTFNSIIGSGTNPSGGSFSCHTSKVANRDAAITTVLKFRKASQGAPEERLSRKEFRETLELKEEDARDEREGKKEERKKAREEAKKRKERMAIENNPFPEDADDDGLPDEDDDDDEDEGEDDDEEDTKALMAELAKIKREREEEEARQQAMKAKEEERSRREEIMNGNPLTSAASAAAGDTSLKRKWDDDTVFKNQARTAPKQKQRYINDAVRSDFHRKFLSKYVWVDGVAH
mmetsp:Transcript_61262/g.145849  ORF Transcript_61262/g.145849 Transcript_61262/m.145849 type:complete len:239 (-) Transcript_61262:109-825(-)|eukprot:CAMPEP_0178419302 /NCGR_PEP_ID=MMETSP0689_2-20121128/25539_1 /TAXON_ID=160604 /ORGANISM="Amphidinium massartii, Strain CS-259" /LENGTH=238 /DNA_ID=CAMNT_0020040733 /DNA_START=44 /DNA_END=760 /DNA_ORIENTATION=-